MLSLACARGPRFIAVALPDGRRRLIRRAATDLEHPASAEVATPRVSARTLLPLARHIRALVTASSAEIIDAAPSSPCCTPGPIPVSRTEVATMAGAPGPLAAAAGAGDRPPATPPARGGTRC